MEARLRVLEQQREDDHAYFVELREHCLKMGSELDKKVQKEAETTQYLRELTARGLQFQQGLAIQKAHSEQAIKVAQEEIMKLTSGEMDGKIAEIVVGTTEALVKLQSHVLQAFAVTSQGQAEDKMIIEQTFVDAAHAMNSLKSSNIPTARSCPITFSTGAMSSSTPTTAVVPGAMAFTKAMYDDLDVAIKSIQKTASDQMFVSGRVDMLWKQVEAQTNVVQVHESAIQGFQASSGSNTYAPCKACGPGVLGATGVPTDDGSSMPKPTGDGSVVSATLLQVIGGNGQCHCIHVDKLIKQVEALEARPTGSPLRAKY